MLTESSVFITRIFTILFTGTVGITILITVMVIIHPSRFRGVVDGVRHIMDGAAVTGVDIIHHITAAILPIGEAVIIQATVVDTIHRITQVTHQTLTVIHTDKEGQPVQLLLEMVVAEVQEFLQVVQEIKVQVRLLLHNQEDRLPTRVFVLHRGVLLVEQKLHRITMC